MNCNLAITKSSRMNIKIIVLRKIVKEKLGEVVKGACCFSVKNTSIIMKRETDAREKNYLQIRESAKR